MDGPASSLVSGRMSPSPPVPPLSPLPIDAVLPELRTAIRASGCAVLQAPPGAGKTTRVPLALMNEEWLAGRRIIMLEPRRIAARAAARHMAGLLGEHAGERIGYRTRLESRIGPRTVVEVVTEGVLTRMLQHDPALEQAGLLVFDEFHERSIHADLGLALSLLSRDVLRPDLRILVMSATLDAAPVAVLLGGAPVVTSTGREWPVGIRWLGTPPRRGIESAAAAAVRSALAEQEGDVLVFLPGRAEIRRAETLLAGAPADILPLYGNLPPATQDRAILPSPPGRRKVVLATSIAESSLTIDGVRVVIDAGLTRVPRFSPRTGMSRLETVRVSRSAADQRAGRAGRLAPGICYRLWSEGEQSGLVPRHRPEILEADLTPMTLELASAGIGDPNELRWLDSPPAGAVSHARALLRELGALDSDSRITPHGRAMAALPLHPRLAHLILRSTGLGLGAAGAALAALLEEHDLLGEGERDADLRRRLDVVLRRDTPAYAHGRPVRRDVLQRVREGARRTARLLPAGAQAASGDADSAGLMLSFAFPDRIAQLRPNSAGRFLLRSGRGAALDSSDPLAFEPWIVAADVGDTGAEGRIHLAAPLTESDVREHHATQITRSDEVTWDSDRDAVRARTVERLGAIVLRETRLADPPPELVTAALLGEIRRRGVAALPWSRAAGELRQRIAFLRLHDEARWPDLSDAALGAALEDWLAPYLAGLSSVQAVAKLDLAALLRARIDPRARAALDAEAPTHVVVPSGSRVAVDYSEPSAPALAVRLQEMFGAADTPRIGGGRVPLTLHLLSPARRPVQVTSDLAGFWKGSYAEVRKEMRGRYPKHRWPEDPLAAAPSARAKPRGRS